MLDESIALQKQEYEGLEKRYRDQQSTVSQAQMEAKMVSGSIPVANGTGSI
jgi:hypothetical protein